MRVRPIASVITGTIVSSAISFAYAESSTSSLLSEKLNQEFISEALDAFYRDDVTGVVHFIMPRHRGFTAFEPVVKNKSGILIADDPLSVLIGLSQGNFTAGYLVTNDLVVADFTDQVLALLGKRQTSSAAKFVHAFSDKPTELEMFKAALSGDKQAYENVMASIVKQVLAIEPDFLWRRVEETIRECAVDLAKARSRNRLRQIDRIALNERRAFLVTLFDIIGWPGGVSEQTLTSAIAKSDIVAQMQVVEGLQQIPTEVLKDPKLEQQVLARTLENVINHDLTDPLWGNALWETAFRNTGLKQRKWLRQALWSAALLYYARSDRQRSFLTNPQLFDRLHNLAVQGRIERVRANIKGDAAFKQFARDLWLNPQPGVVQRVGVLDLSSHGALDTMDGRSLSFFLANLNSLDLDADAVVNFSVEVTSRLPDGTLPRVPKFLDVSLPVQELKRIAAEYLRIPAGWRDSWSSVLQSHISTRMGADVEFRVNSMCFEHLSVSGAKFGLSPQRHSR